MSDLRPSDPEYVIGVAVHHCPIATSIREQGDEVCTYETTFVWHGYYNKTFEGIVPGGAVAFAKSFDLGNYRDLHGEASR